MMIHKEAKIVKIPEMNHRIVNPKVKIVKAIKIKAKAKAKIKINRKVLVNHQVKAPEDLNKTSLNLKALADLKVEIGKRGLHLARILLETYLNLNKVKVELIYLKLTTRNLEPKKMKVRVSLIHPHPNLMEKRAKVP